MQHLLLLYLILEYPARYSSLGCALGRSRPFQKQGTNLLSYSIQQFNRLNPDPSDPPRYLHDNRHFYLLWASEGIKNNGQTGVEKDLQHAKDGDLKTCESKEEREKMILLKIPAFQVNKSEECGFHSVKRDGMVIYTRQG
jgi:hypothetical protein